MNRFLLVLVTFVVTNTFQLKSQIDTTFWFAAPEISSGLGDQPVFLRFCTYSNASTVTLSMPANGSFTPIVKNIAANSVDSIDLTSFLAQVESHGANIVDNTGLRITATQAVNAYYELRNANNREVFSLKGSKAIGTNFYTPFQTFWSNGSTTPASYSSFEIVATQNNTTVLITPRTAIVGHAQNATFSIVLNQGETYSARDLVVSGVTSLAGSIVSSDKPIAVTVYTGAVSESGCLNSMGDQITTADYAGTDFIIHKASAYNERVYILATQNNTSLNIYDDTDTTNSVINWSETNEFVLSDTVTYIKSNKPVYVWHASGYGCKISGAQVPNIYCSGTYNTAFTRSSSDSIGIVLFVRSGFESMFTLNGNASLIPSSSFLSVPGTNGSFKSALIYFSTADVAVNSYNLVNNTGDIFGFGVLSGKSNSGSSYAYFSEFSSYPFVQAGSDVTVCANVPLNLNGFVGGGSVTGTWSGTGFGTFQNPLSSLTNTYVPSLLDTAVSPIKLILSSTGPCPVQRDTMTVTITPSPIVNASTDQVICANNPNVMLVGSVTGGSTTGIWSSLGSGTFSPTATDLNASYMPSSADTAAGMVQLVLTSTNIGTCSVERDTMSITITPAPFVDAGPASASVCTNNSTVIVNGTVGGSTGTGKWLTSGNGIFSPNNTNLTTSYLPTGLDLLNGSVTLFLASTNNGNCLAATDSIVVSFTPAPVADAGLNVIACTNSPSVLLSGSITGPTTSGYWSGGNGNFSPDSSALNAVYTPTASEIAGGFMFLTLTSSNNGNCSSVNDNIRIDFVAPPSANFSFASVCLNGNSNFIDFSLPGFGIINQWNWDFGNGVTSTQQNPSYIYPSPGTYNVQLVTANSSGCKDTVTKTVEVYPLPIVNFNYGATCTGTQVDIQFTDSTVIVGDTISQWIWDFGGAGASTQQNPSQVFLGTGNYFISLIASSSHGCRDTLQQIVTVNPRPNAGFYYNVSGGVNVATTVSLFDTSSYAIGYQWFFGDNTPVSVLQNPEHNYYSNGLYNIVLVVNDNLGCTDTANAYVNINNITTEILTLIPNALSPNGDGKNDVWKLEFIKLLYPEAEVEIYNRWGQQVFVSLGYNNPWDGTLNGDALPAGTYYYVLKLKDPNQPEVFKGSILLLR